MTSQSVLRLSKCALLLSIGFYFSLVVFNNVTDYESNHQYVRHVLTMDSTFNGNRGLWRAIDSPRIHTFFYLTIILWEAITGVLCWWGAGRMLAQRRGSDAAFQRSKSVAIAALTLGCLLWFVAFLTVGGEWFLMWQSKTWDGRDSAFRMFASLALVLVYLSAPEPATNRVF